MNKYYYRFELECVLSFDVEANTVQQAVKKANEVLSEFETVQVDLGYGAEHANLYPPYPPIELMANDIVDSDDEEA